MDTDKGRSVVTAHLFPLAEMLNYTTELRSMTGGRGVFSMEEAHYDQVPSHLQEENYCSRRSKTSRRRRIILQLLEMQKTVQLNGLFFYILISLFENTL